MGITVAVAGASGYAGGELLRLVAAHPELELGPLAAGESAGRTVTDVHPQLRSLADRTFVPTEASALGRADAVLLALPHGHSAAVAAELPASVPVVDLGADHRLRDASRWAHYYGGDHAGAWAYGVPELPGQRSLLAGATRIAGGGYHPTAVILALAPLLAARLVEPIDVAVVSVTGTSGAGRSANAAFTSAQVMGDVTAYKVGRHQHTAEILQALGDAGGAEVTVSFTPVLAPLPRGILATCTARTAASAATLRQALDAAYWDEPFVDLLPDGVQPHTGATLGGNGAQLQVTVDDSAGRAVVTCALDNLVKGAAGQAVQCLNLALGLDETAGLTAEGVWP
ncbi:MAG: N-acetyl-gamma-glutamyl-phosphate reductase [Mycobacteriales bacterium]